MDISKIQEINTSKKADEEERKNIPFKTPKKLFECVSIESCRSENHDRKAEICENGLNSPCLIPRKDFHLDFLQMQNHLGMMNNLRRLQIDAVLKKCKSKFFKSVHEVLKSCLRCTVDRLPQKFITDIKVDTNKQFLPMTMLGLYQHFGLLRNMDQLSEKNMVRLDKKPLLSEFLSLSYKVLFETYLLSEQYHRDYELIREENQNLAVLFDFTCKIFLQYYATSNGKTRDSRRRYNLMYDDDTAKIQEQI